MSVSDDPIDRSTETSAQLIARAEFYGFVAEPRDMDICPHYVLWQDGDVVAKGCADTIRSSLRNVTHPPPSDWELANEHFNGQS